MLQRGRKGTAAVSIVPIESVPRLRPPPGLGKAEDALFRQVVAQCSADHFTASDSPLIVAYCQAVLISRSAFTMIDESGVGFQTWQQAARTLATLATKLRLCPHSRTDPRTITRHARGLGLSVDAYLDMATRMNDLNKRIKALCEAKGFTFMPGGAHRALRLARAEKMDSRTSFILLSLLALVLLLFLLSF